MVTRTQKSLLDSENLTLPTVIMMTANMGCAQCRRRVSHLVSKMTGIREYTLDVPNKLMTVKGDFVFHNKKMKEDDDDSERSIGCFDSFKFFKSFRATLVASA